MMDIQFKQHFLERWEGYVPGAELPIGFYYTDEESHGRSEAPSKPSRCIINAVIAPFGSGCAAIVQYPYHELQSPHPRAVLGMFDVSARPCVPANALTFAVPWPKFVRMVDNMEESFLITGSWSKVRARIGRR